jgi:hypothetical protein
MKFKFPNLERSPSIFHIYEWREIRKNITQNANVQRSFIRHLFQRYNLNIYQDLSR